MKSHIAFIVAPLLFAGTLFVGLSVAHGQPSQHRKIKKGVGNCVFSTKVLGYKKDAHYKLQTKFVAPALVYSRCYYAKKLSQYRSVGKLKSQLRGLPRKRRGPALNRRLQFPRPVAYYAHTVKYKGRKDQTRMDIIPSGSCDFKEKPRTGKCVSLEGYVRKMAEMQKASLPFTTKICVHIDFDVVNRKIRNPNNLLQLIDQTEFHTLAKGCFSYTVK